MIKVLETILTRAASWPKAAQEELARVAHEIEIEHSGEVYKLSAEERAAVEVGIAEADRGEFVSEAEVEVSFSRHAP